MYFCPFCTGLLFTEQTPSVVLSCSSCPYIYKVTDTLITIEYNESKKGEDDSLQEDELMYANKCAETCPKCSYMEAMFVEVQTRSADEPSTIFYRCVNCKFDWRE